MRRRSADGVLATKEGNPVDSMWQRVGTQLVARVSGPLKFRVILQPAMATFFAIRDGLADARSGKSPYFATLCEDPQQRRELIRNGWKSVSKIFILALLLDVVYQLMELHFVYLGEAIIVACVLAILPYVILRGLVTRATRRSTWRQHGGQTRPI